MILDPTARFQQAGVYMKLLSLLLTIVLAPLLLGSCSAYHSARESLPADAAARLDQRLAEARSAETAALDVAQALAGTPAPSPESVDRLDLKARELTRRVLAAEDVDFPGLTTAQSTELSRLRKQSSTLTDLVSLFRSGDNKTATRAVGDLLNTREAPNRGAAP
jgi:hypothetical protein